MLFRHSDLYGTEHPRAGEAEHPAMHMFRSGGLGRRSFEKRFLVPAGSPDLHVGDSKYVRHSNPDAILTRVEGKKHVIENVYFQDPCFSHKDNAFLDKLGYQILQTPAGLEKMTGDTFFFCPCLEYYAIAEALQVAQPSFYVGNFLSDWADRA